MAQRLCACAALRAGHRSEAARDLFRQGAKTLCHMLASERRPDWAWFEAVLGYDNPRLPQALIEAALLDEREDWLSAGLDSLRFIASRQIAAAGHFRPVGSDTFHKPFAVLPFDQQPLEAWAAIDAAAVAHQATGDRGWLRHAETAYRWFLGANDRGVVLGDIASGRCRDGVTPHGANENTGAESILAFQLAHYKLREMIASDSAARNQVEGPALGRSERTAHNIAHS
jgi:hypothetical protein